MPKPLKLMLLVSAFLFGLITIGFCQENITLTTYYPAPYGSYNEILLYPHTPPVIGCDDAHKGLMYYDSAEDTIKVCHGTALQWKAPSYWTLNQATSLLYADNASWNVGIGTVAGAAGKLDITADAGGNNAIVLRHSGGSGTATFGFTPASDATVNLNTAGATTIHLESNGPSYFNGGNVGIGVLNPTEGKLQVDSGGIGYGIYSIGDTGVYGYSASGTGVSGQSGSSGNGGAFNSASGNGVYGESNSGTGVSGAGFTGVSGTGNTGVYGESTVTIGTGVYGTGTTGVYGTGSTGVDGRGNTGVNGTGTVVGIHGSSGATAGLFDGTVIINGNLSITGTINGADVAEGIDCPGCAATDVVVIDPSNNLKFNRSSRAYDYTVAGVISEKPSLNLSKSEAKNHPPLALAGLVKCKVTAENGAIKRGDLLVTSSKPGHAMRADLDKIKPGMIVGKALEPWEKGEGKIAVLVGSN